MQRSRSRNSKSSSRNNKKTKSKSNTKISRKSFSKKPIKKYCSPDDDKISKAYKTEQGVTTIKSMNNSGMLGGVFQVRLKMKEYLKESSSKQKSIDISSYKKIKSRKFCLNRILI